MFSCSLSLVTNCSKCIIVLSVVKAKHAELVPAKMSEGEFWLQFFQSQLFHNDSIPASNSKKNLFTNVLAKEQKCKITNGALFQCCITIMSLGQLSQK